MKKMIALILTIAILLSFTLPTSALTRPAMKSPAMTVRTPANTAPALSLRTPPVTGPNLTGNILTINDLVDFILKNFRFLSDESKAALEALKPQIENWANLSAEEKTKLRNELLALVKTIKREITDNRAALDKLREETKPLFDEIMANNRQLEIITRENAEIRAKIRVKLNFLKNDGTYEMSQELKNLFAELKEKIGELGTTKGDIRDILEANKDNRENLDLDAIKAAFEEVIAIQEARILLVTDINALLTRINGLLPRPTAPAGTGAPTATPVPSV